jgi:ribosomal protein L9
VKIVLRADVDNLGNKGDLVEVAPGYARNYLVPKGLAMVAGPGIERQSEAMRRSRQVRDKREKEGAEATARQLAAKRVEIKARAGEGGRLFGSITSSDIAHQVPRHARGADPPPQRGRGAPHDRGRVAVSRRWPLTLSRRGSMIEHTFDSVLGVVSPAWG